MMEIPSLTMSTPQRGQQGRYPMNKRKKEAKAQEEQKAKGGTDPYSDSLIDILA